MTFLTTLWIAFIMFPNLAPFPVGFYSSQQDCEYVEKQLKEKLHPKITACIETPQRKQE